MALGKEIKDETVKASRKVCFLWCLYSMYNDAVVLHSCLSRYLQNTNNNLQLLLQPTCFSTALLRSFVQGFPSIHNCTSSERRKENPYCGASVTFYKSHDPAAML